MEGRHSLERLRNAVAGVLERHGGHDVIVSPIAGVSIATTRSRRLPAQALYRPALGLVVQGAKRVLVGQRSLDYVAGQALLTSLLMPATGQVLRASARAPFIGVVLELDASLLREVVSLLDQPPPASPADFGLSVHAPDAPVLDALARMVELAASPDAVPVLLAGLQRELAYWLLKGPAGPQFAGLALPGDDAARIGRALHFLQRHYREALSVESLAVRANMAVSQFHRRFRALTAMSPLQYQKRLRLLDARQRLERGADSVTAVAYAVGYGGLSQFSRDYARYFGHPPGQARRR